MRRNLSITFALLLCLAAGLATQGKSKAKPQSGDLAGQAEALLALSDRQNFEDHALARETAQQALAIWQSLGDNPGIARACIQVGYCYMAQNDLPEATQYFERALQIWRDLNNVEEQARVLIGLGFLENRKGEWTTSLSLFTQAQNLIEGIEGKDVPFRKGQIASGLADIFNQNGLPETGLNQYLQALDYFRQTPDTYDDAITVWAIGATYYQLENYPEAIAHLQKALIDLGPNTSDRGLCNEYIGRAYIANNEYSTALPYLQSALDIYTRAGNPREAGRALGLIGQVYEHQGKLELARQTYQQALAALRGLSDRINQAAIYYAIGRLELKSGNVDVAQDYLRQSIEVSENIRQASTSRDLIAAFTASIYDRYEAYIECLMLKHQANPAQGFAVRAFETSEQARGRSLAELLQATETNLVPGLDPQLATQEKALRQALRAKEDYKVTLLSGAHKQEELDALEAELARLNGEYKQVIEAIQARFPSYHKITEPAVWNLQKIQEQVIADDQTVLLEYSLGSDKSYVWAVTRDSIKSYDLPPRALIEEAVKKVYKLLADAPDPNTAAALDPALQAVSQMVLSPVAAELGKSRIIVVADGSLHYIPFQALPGPSAADELLVANHEIINAPSASILGELREEAAQRHPTKLLAAFGDPVFAQDYAQRKDEMDSQQSAAVQALETAPWQHALRDVELNGDVFDPSVIQPLFHAKRELANLREVASGGEAFIASEFTATRERLLNTDLTQFAILHFATHGLLDPKRPENSGLVLSTVDRNGQVQNGFVGLQDIYGLRAPVDLVVLSACQTALGKDVRGEGLLGLTRGFMYAGASSVIASLWKVDDEATAELMRQVYINMLQKRMTPAAALRAAQNSIRQKPEWRSPYYWAGFTLQGEYRQVIKPTSALSAAGSYKRIMIVGGLLLLAGFALGYYRLRRRTQQTSS